MTATQKQRAELPATSTCGLLLLDGIFKTVAIDRGASTILADCNGQLRLDDSTVIALPRQIDDLVRNRSWTSISGTCVTVTGVNGTYRCTLFQVDCNLTGAQPPILALHFQRGVSADDAIQHIAASCNLTIRELEVLKCVSTGMTSKEIAIELDISPNTVKSYLRLIMVKIGVTTRSGIVGKLLEHVAGVGR